MKLKIFSVYDEKAKCFLSPFTTGEVGQATRSFADAVNGDTDLNRHPEDFTLHQLGTFDNQSGEVQAQGPILIAHALELKTDKYTDRAQMGLPLPGDPVEKLQ